MPLATADGAAVDASGLDDQRNRHERWLVRPEVELLLLRYWCEHPEQPIGPDRLKPWVALRIYYRSAAAPSLLQPRSLTELNRWARARQALVLPPFLREALCGRFQTTPLDDAVHRRFCTGERVWQADDALPLRCPCAAGQPRCARPCRALDRSGFR